MLATGTVVTVVISFFFLRVVPISSYAALPSHEPDRPEAQALHRTKSSDSRNRLLSDETGAPQDSIDDPHKPRTNGFSRGSNGPDKNAIVEEGDPETRTTGTDETLSLLSSADFDSADKHSRSDEHARHGHLDIRGFLLLRNVEFWQQFMLMGILTGIGLMTIK